MGNLGSLPYGQNLDAIFDSDFKCDKQINTVVAVFSGLGQLKQIQPHLSTWDGKKRAHAFISSYFSYCKSLYVGQSCLAHLQLVTTLLLQSWLSSTGSHVSTGSILAPSYIADLLYLHHPKVAVNNQGCPWILSGCTRAL